MRRLPAAGLCLLVTILLASCGGGSGDSGLYQTKEASRYSHALHDQLYRAWVQPQAVQAPRGKISVPVDLAIDAQGRVRRFKLARSSGFPAIDESVRAVGRSVGQVAPPPVTSPRQRFNLRVFFDLDVK